MRPCASGVLQYLEACRSAELWRAATSALLHDLSYPVAAAAAARNSDAAANDDDALAAAAAGVAPGAQPTKAHYVSALRTLRDSGQAAGCAQLLLALAARHAPGLDAGCFNVAIGACADAGNASLAARLARDMAAANVRCAISALHTCSCFFFRAPGKAV